MLAQISAMGVEAANRAKDLVLLLLEPPAPGRIFRSDAAPPLLHPSHFHFP